MHLAVLFALLQHPAAPAAFPVSRVEITPPAAEIEIGQTVRLAARALDVHGQPVTGAAIAWYSGGTEGDVDSTGLVKGGYNGYVRVTAVAYIPGQQGQVFGDAVIHVLPEPAARIDVAPAPAKAIAGTRLTLAGAAYSKHGDRRADLVSFSSSNPRVASVTADGRLHALAPGRVTITAKAGPATTQLPLQVVASTVTRLAVEPASSAVRTGDVIRFTVNAKDTRGRAIADVPVEWAVAASGEGSAAVAQIDATGAFVAETPGVYTIDIADPASPKIVDSMLTDARLVNDVMTTEDGKYGVFSREGASNRKNGIVVFDANDACHPKPVAEYTETVSGGVHSSYVYQGRAYITDDATGSMRVIDIRDATHPKEVARWEAQQTEAGRYLHDIMVVDGLAYLAYWNDGLIILDVGNGLKGGSPENPQLVSQLKYDLNATYARVEQLWGTGFVRGTHTAWRAGKYVFVGDEVYAARPYKGLSGGNNLTFGRLHVVDVSDIQRPREVAWYEPTDGGVHNVWVVGDTLYLGNYQGGARVLDISGELRGDLLRQGREMSWILTADSTGSQPHTPFAWGAVVRDGNIFVPDINSGLWVLKLEPKAAPLP